MPAAHFTPTVDIVCGDGWGGGGSLLLTIAPSPYALSLLCQPRQLRDQLLQPAGLPVRTAPRQYLFNACEGLQRHAADTHTQLGGIGTLFCSRLHGGAAGGLSGLVYALADRGSARLEVYGPPGTASLLAAMRQGYLRRRYPEVAPAEFSGALGEFWQDEDVLVYPVLLRGGGGREHCAETAADGAPVNPYCPMCTGRIKVAPAPVEAVRGGAPDDGRYASSNGDSAKRSAASAFSRPAGAEALLGRSHAAKRARPAAAPTAVSDGKPEHEGENMAAAYTSLTHLETYLQLPRY